MLAFDTPAARIAQYEPELGRDEAPLNLKMLALPLRSECVTQALEDRIVPAYEAIHLIYCH